MVSFDQLFDELNRFTVGYEPTFSTFERAKGYNTDYPPYNIEKIGDDRYQISLAVAGFKESDLELQFQNGKLSIKGALDDGGKEYVYKGIATRQFYKEFHIQEHVKITGANLENGILKIDLLREVPESMKPRKIEITTSNAGARIENKSA